jgi:tRNA (cmo5U34)-methyltransferase
LSSEQAGAPHKSTVEEIRNRFDHEVERFSNLETGQTATIDAPLVLELIAQSAAAVTPHAVRLLDVGCGAGNYSLKLLSLLPNLEVTLVDLSRPMLDRAVERVARQTKSAVYAKQADIRQLDLPDDHFDLIAAAAVLHHLRGDDEWRQTFGKLHRALRPGGSLWIADLVEHTSPRVQSLMWRRYGDYLEGLGGPDYRDKVYAYVEKEDSPRPLAFQIELLREVGFRSVEVLHKNSVFAAFGAIK